MLYKTGVVSEGVNPPVFYACGVFETLYWSRGYRLVATSMRDGVHKTGIHGTGNAVDLRIRDVRKEDLTSIVESAKLLLYPLGFDVVLESDHIHCEFDPRPGRGSWFIEDHAKTISISA